MHLLGRIIKSFWKEGVRMGGKTSSRGVATAVIFLGLTVALMVNGWDRQRMHEGSPAEPDGVAMVNGDLEQGQFAGYEQSEDPLLVLVNQEVALPEDWSFFPYLVDDEVVDRRMGEDLVQMIEAAERDQVWLWVASGYRSEERQQIVLEHAVLERRNRGMGEKEAWEDALRTVAFPGHSEHHTGLAVDFNQVTDQFVETPAFLWLQEHGAEYGFIQRYPPEKESITGMAEESWHYRYVGKEHAQAMEKRGDCLEEYVLEVKGEN